MSLPGIVSAELLLTPSDGGGFSASDDFNRADGGLGSNWTTDNDWFYGPLSIASNAVPLPSTSGSAYYYNNGTFAADQYSEVTVTGIGSWSSDIPGVTVRFSISGNNCSYYRAYGSQYIGGYLRIQKFVESPYGDTSLFDGVISGGHTFADGDVFRLEAVDEGSDVRLKVYINGSQVQTYLDTSSPLTGGSPGLWMAYTAGSGPPSADSWEGGDL